jgi:DNA-binding Lrp family transcriptional regulator
VKVELLSVLQVMSEVTHRMDLTEFAKTVGLGADEALQGIQELAKTGYLKKAGGGFGITEKGKAVLKAQLPVAEGLEFRFYSGLGQPAGLSAASLREFLEVVKSVDVGVLEFHLYRGDFKSWAEGVLKDAAFAGEFEDMQVSELRGESLRKRMVFVIERRYGSDALSC